MERLLRMSHATEPFVERVGRLGSLLILPLIAIIMFDVVVRRVPALFHFVMATPLGPYLTSTRLQEMEWHLHGMIIFLVIGFAYLRNSHVRIDLVRQRLDFRGQAAIEAGGILLFLLPIIGVLLYYSWFFLMRSYVSGEGSPSMAGLPNRWIIKSFLLAGMVLMLLSALTVLVRLIAFLLTGRSKSEARLGMLLEQHLPPGT